MRVITDSGSYVYTRCPEARNRFRATAAHNTPLVDGVEQNRIPESLWQLEDDASPEVLVAEELRFRGSHTGYLRLPDPVRPLRTIELDPQEHVLTVRDEFEARGPHAIEIPFHLAPGLEPGEPSGDATVPVGPFVLRWQGDWTCTVEDAWVSPSYGVKVPTHKVVFRRDGPVETLLVTIA
jgi:hypothetical protein